ncbi:MAG: sensor histidine kinase [Burkholderiales bacterium]|nr:sensor histidine kinase [Burkholderiales bacterium]
MKRLRGLRGSLRVRLLAGTLAWIVVSIVVAGFGLASLFRQHVERQFHAELSIHLDQLTANLVQDAQGGVALSMPLSDPRFSKPYSGLYWQIDRLPSDRSTGAAGVLRSRSLWDGVLDLPPAAVARGELERHRLAGPEGKPLGAVTRTVFAQARPDHPVRLAVAADEALMMEPVARFSGALWLALALLGLGLVAAAVIQVVVGLAPLQRLQRGLAAVRAGRAQKLEGEYPAEVEPLVQDFNAVLSQNADIVARARTHAGNLAHALKTPLSVLANAANAAGAAEADGKLAALVREQVETARKHVDYHLRRARAAAAVRIPGARTPLRPVAEGLVRAMRRIHAARNLDIVIAPLAAELAFGGEEQDLQEMLGNLLDNACKWATRRVELRALQDASMLVIVIDDDGPGIAEEQRQHLLRRGARADEQTPGSGLGLAIVDELARLYGGGIELATSPAGGLRTVLSLPRA